VADEGTDDWKDDEPDAHDLAPTRYYANLISLLTGTRDLAVDFGYVIGDEPPDWGARIVMSWEEAHVLQRYLNAAIQQYVDREGPVRDVERLDTGQANGGTIYRPDEDEGDGDENPEG
jgi:hypothetical protein